MRLLINVTYFYLLCMPPRLCFLCFVPSRPYFYRESLKLCQDLHMLGQSMWPGSFFLFWWPAPRSHQVTWGQGFFSANSFLQNRGTFVHLVSLFSALQDALNDIHFCQFDLAKNWGHVTWGQILTSTILCRDIPEYTDAFRLEEHDVARILI